MPSGRCGTAWSVPMMTAAEQWWLLDAAATRSTGPCTVPGSKTTSTGPWSPAARRTFIAVIKLVGPPPMPALRGPLRLAQADQTQQAPRRATEVSGPLAIMTLRTARGMERRNLDALSSVGDGAPFGQGPRRFPGAFGQTSIHCPPLAPPVTTILFIVAMLVPQ